TLYYDEDKEVWVAVNSNADLTAALFPAEKKLVLKKKGEEELNLLNKREDANKKKVTIEEILAAAEGDTEETKSKTVKAKWKHRTVGYTSLSLTLTFVLSAVGLAFLNLNTIQTLNPAQMLTSPFVIIAAIDAFLALCLALSVTTVYPLVRFRAVAGLGCIALYFYSFDQMTLAALFSISMVCAFLNTFITRVSVFMITGPGAVGGMIGFLLLYFVYLNPPQA
ncbi:MAG: hypothetical protein KJT03_10865, partial [Verrucomicrobiae bacterium]|nr:hypothetical protein [Verrucomicrobiae bacterium]